MASQAKLDALIDRHRRDVERLTKRLAKDGDAEAFADDLYTVLTKGHSDAVTLGRQLAGDKRRQTEADQLLGLDTADHQTGWLDGFMADIEDGRYALEDGSLNVAQVKRRADMYVSQLRSTANQSFVDHSPERESFDWVMGMVEDHCSECPTMAAASPLTANELYIVPGQATCLHNCHCHLIRLSDGVEGFRLAA